MTGRQDLCAGARDSGHGGPWLGALNSESGMRQASILGEGPKASGLGNPPQDRWQSPHTDLWAPALPSPGVKGWGSKDAMSRGLFSGLGPETPGRTYPLSGVSLFRCRGHLLGPPFRCGHYTHLQLSPSWSKRGPSGEQKGHSIQAISLGPAGLPIRLCRSRARGVGGWGWAVVPCVGKGKGLGSDQLHLNMWEAC